MTDILAPAPPEFAPEPPPSGPIVWARENLFPDVKNTILTLFFGGVAIVFIRALLNFIFAQGRRWDAVTINLRLLMVQAYPEDDFHRVWISVGIVVVLGAISLAVWASKGRTSMQRIGKGLMIGGAVLAVAAILGPFSIPARITNLIIGAVLFAAGYVPLQRVDRSRAKEEFIPSMLVVAILAGLAILGLYFLDVPVPSPEGGQELQGVASSTTTPITVLYVIAVAAYLVALWARDRLPERLPRSVITTSWVVSVPLITLVILRNPSIAYDEFFTKYDFLGESAFGGFLTVALFTVVAAAIIFFVSRPGAGELGRVVAGLLILVAIGTWAVSALIGVRILLLLLGLFAVAAPTFAGEARARNRYILAWLIAVPIVVYLLLLGEAAATIEVPGRSYLGGLILTFVLATFGIVLSFPIGLLLALGRTSTMPIFRLLSVGYIEIVRGVPLITWLIVGSVLLPLFLPLGLDIDSAVRAIIAIAFFSAAYLAENVRGGLQSIPKGQYEAAHALGMTTVQLTVFIVLPQAIRAVIPALVGQTIAIFKDTSLVTIVSLFDFLHIARAVIPTQTTPFNFLGSIKETLLFAAAVYWIFTFGISRASLRLEKKLGVGER